jgi:hypothetical protein
LEDRCLLSYTPTLVDNSATKSLDQVLATPAGLPGKFVTIMNNSTQMVYPILQDANSTLDGTATKVVRLNLTNGGSGYNSQPGQGPSVQIEGGGGSGATAEAVVNGQGQIYALNLLTPGIGYTSPPTVKFMGGGGINAAATALISTLLPGSKDTSLYDPLDSYNQSYRGYIGEFNPATQQVEFGLQPGHQVTVQVPLVFWDGGRLFLASNGPNPFQSATDPGNPLQNTPAWTFNTAAQSFVVQPNQPFSATFPDPSTRQANANGRVMWYHDAVPHDFATDASGQLTEWTIRDPQLVNYAPNMPQSQILTIFNYDVSYVDNLTLPAGMEITKVPIQTPPGYGGPPIPSAPYANLGTDLTIAQMQDGMSIFTATDPTEQNPDLGPYFGGRGYDRFYFPGGTSGIDFDKLPAGYNLIALSPNAQVASSYDSSKFQLVSGGTFAQVDTHSSGIATQGSNQITGVDASVIAQLAPGMQYQIVNFPIVGGITPIFPQGTYITSVSGTTITMSNTALQNGPDQSPNNQISYTFVGSRFTSAKGSTNGTDAVITQIDPAAGIYLQPGMLVAGPGITAYTTIATISPDYTQITLNGPAPAAGSGSAGTPYVFTGAPSSYVVSTLINNWYSWADYYVNNVNATPQTSSGSTYGPGPKGGLKDPNALTLYGLDQTVVKNLRVGDGVTGPNIPAHQVTTVQLGNLGSGYKLNDILTVSGGTFKTVATLKVVGVNNAGGITGIAINQPGDYSAPPNNPVSVTGGSGTGALFLLNFSPTVTISAILSATSVQLSNPAPSAVTNGSFSFTPPAPIIRSSDAKPYTLTFTTAEQKQTALDFSQTVYDVMSGFSLLSAPSYLSRSALLLDYVIGGNIGTFILQGQVLPDLRLNQLRDGLKSVLRGVANFDLTPEFNPETNVQQWYPDPSVGTEGAMINGAPANFGVYNLNPYVWFIHVKLGMSGYGFSLDDDTANAQDASSSLQLAYGGTKYTAPVAEPPTLDNLELYTYGAPFGTLQDQGHVDVTSGVAKGYDLKKFTVIGGLSLETVAKLKAFDAKNGQGALVTGPGMTVGKSRVYYVGPANPVAGANASYVVLLQPSPAQDGPTGQYTFSGFNTVLADGTQLSSPVPSITNLSQSSGGPGTVITLSGSAFKRALGATINGVPAKIVGIDSDATIRIEVPADATTGLIGIRSPGGTGYSPIYFSVTGVAAPTIGSFDPPSGSLGTMVTIKGSGFLTVTKVTFNNFVSDSVTIVDDATIKARVPIGASTGAIAVANSQGTATSSTNFIVNAPSIASFSPPSGVVGTPVTLKGSGFTGASVVTFNNTPATTFSVIADDTLQVVVPTGATTGVIIVSTSAGDGTSASSFTVTAAVKPTVTSFSPTSGPVGTPVTIKGANFTNASQVTFNDTPADFTVVDDATITATVPTLATTGVIAVTNPAGTGSSSTSFTVTAAAFPKIDSFSPQSGPVGTPITLKGSNFTGASFVYFGDVEAGFIFIDDGTINTTVPTGAVSAPISVYNSAGSGSSPTTFIVNENTPESIAVVSGTPQSTKINTAFAASLQAVVKDESGNPVPGVNVTFTAPASGASGTFANGTTTETRITNLQGIATSSTFTANSVVGGAYVVTASTDGVATPANFSLTNIAVLTTADSVGAFDPSTGTWYLRNSNTSGPPDAGTFIFGGVKWIPVVGDWNGNGTTTVGVVDPSTMTWYLRNTNSAGAPDYQFQFGAPGWIPVVGDWQHTGHTGIGAFDPKTATWYLRNDPSNGSPSIPAFSYGGAGWTPVVGDWDGNGTSTVGAVDPSNMRWYLRDNNNSGGVTVNTFTYGAVGWTPVTGDWTGQGKSTVGAVDPQRQWYLRNSNSSGGPDIPVFKFGAAGWNAVAGHWNSSMAQLAAGGPTLTSANAKPLNTTQLQVEVRGALARLQQAGVSAALIARLSSVQFIVSQLSAGTLALTTASANRVVIDANAAGYGWFVDSTPQNDMEFSSSGGVLQARAGSAAAGHMDLLTVILHEMGHFNGWTELDPSIHPNDLMAITLVAGARRTQALDSVFADRG